MNEMLVLDTMTEADAEALWLQLRREGKHGVGGIEPRLPGLGRDSVWVDVAVPFEWLRYDWQESPPSAAKKDRAARYAEQHGEFPPGVALFNERSALRGATRAFVADGNHRGLAGWLRGDDTVRMLMPASDAARLEEQNE